MVPKTKEAERVASAAEAFDGLRRRLCHDRQLGLTRIHNLLADGELRQRLEELNDAVTACHGWPEGTWRDENETLKRLMALNRDVGGGDVLLPSQAQIEKEQAIPGPPPVNPIASLHTVPPTTL